MELSRHPLFLPWLLALALIAAFAVQQWYVLPQGSIQHTDEFLTLDRSHSFLIRDDYLTVYSESQPTFKKPPLQYWATAWLMQHTNDLEVALRMPSYLCAIALLVVTGILVGVLSPATPWAIPAAIALLAGAKTFGESAQSALLDMGATLFATVAMLACWLALRKPRWWYVVALVSGLAALQKAPIPPLVVAAMVGFLYLTRKRHDIDVGSALRNRHFLGAALLTVALVAFWPALQWALHGTSALAQAYVGEMVDRFNPATESRRPSSLRVLLNGEGWLRLPAIVALFALPRVLRRYELAVFPFLLVGFVILTAVAGGHVSRRYSILLMPLLMTAFAVVTVRVVPGRVLPVVVIAAFALSSGGPFKSARFLGLTADGPALHVPMLQSVSRSLGESESLVMCNWGRRKSPKLFRGAVSYYASNGRPFQVLLDPQELSRLEGDRRIEGPYRGVCNAEQFAELRPWLADPQIVESAHGYVHWTSRRSEVGTDAK
jgi:4-amino-4-deoxy-L-arabinose transferase-like glycosyltransferase